MLRCMHLVVASVFLAAAVFLPSAPDVDAAQAKGKPKQPAKAKFKPPTKSNPSKLFRVQARSPQWRPVTIAPNKVVAQNIKRTLKRQGWQVKMRSNRVGQVAIRARVVKWHTRAVVPNPAVAQQLAMLLRSQGLQARVR